MHTTVWKAGPAVYTLWPECHFAD